MFNFIKQLYKDLTSTPDGKFSHTKFWANIAYCTATFVIIKLTYFHQLTENYFLIYIGVVAAHGTASKFLSTKIDNHKE